jgi:hypothetical protein
MLTDRQLLSATVVNEAIYVIGDLDAYNGEVLRTVEMYEPAFLHEEVFSIEDCRMTNKYQTKGVRKNEKTAKINVGVSDDYGFYCHGPAFAGSDWS